MQAENVSVFEIPPHRHFVLEFLLRFVICNLVMALDLFANDFDGSDDALSSPWIKRVNFFDDTETTAVDSPANDVLIVQPNGLTFIIRFGLSGCGLRGDFTSMP